MTTNRTADHRFDVLPEPVRLEDTRTSQDVVDHPAETDELGEITWALRHAAG